MEDVIDLKKIENDKTKEKLFKITGFEQDKSVLVQ